MAVKGLIFDMDGTLIDSMGYWRDLRRIVCEKSGVPVEGELAAMVDGDADWGEVRNYLWKHYGLYEDEMDFWQVCYGFMAELYAAKVEPMPGLMEFLHAMEEKGYLLGVATATPRDVAAIALEHTGILPLIDGFVSTKDVGVEKVKPTVYLECARQMGNLKKEEVVIFGLPQFMRTVQKESLCKIIKF